MAKQKQKQIKMQVQMGALAAIPQLESRTDEQLQGESRHRVAAKAILGARAAERYDAKAGLGTVIATMLPYSVAFLVGWGLLLALWLLLGLPLGPGAGLFLQTS